MTKKIFFEKLTVKDEKKIQGGAELPPGPDRPGCETTDNLPLIDCLSGGDPSPFC